MKCSSCGASISLSAKFCPECGEKVVLAEFGDNEINNRWIADALIAGGFDVGVNDNMLVASREGGTKFSIWRLESLPLIAMQVIWTMTGAGFTNRRAFTDAVNKATQNNWLCSAYFSDDLKTVVCNTCMYIPGKLAPQHVVEYSDLFLWGVAKAMKDADLYRFG